MAPASTSSARPRWRIRLDGASWTPAAFLPGESPLFSLTHNPPSQVTLFPRDKTRINGLSWMMAAHWEPVRQTLQLKQSVRLAIQSLAASSIYWCIKCFATSGNIALLCIIVTLRLHMLGHLYTVSVWKSMRHDLLQQLVEKMVQLWHCQQFSAYFSKPCVVLGPYMTPLLSDWFWAPGLPCMQGIRLFFFPTNWAIIIVRVSSSCGVWASFHLFNELSQSKLQAAGGSPFNTYFMNVLNARVPTHTHATRRVLCVVSAWKLCATSDNSFLK